MRHLLMLQMVLALCGPTFGGFFSLISPSHTKPTEHGFRNSDGTLEIVLEQEGYRLLEKNGEGKVSTLDDVAEWAVQLFEEQVQDRVQHSLEKGEKLDDNTLKLWRFCTSTVLSCADAYMQQIPWCPPSRERSSFWDWDWGKAPKWTNGLEHYTIKEPLKDWEDWCKCYGDDVVSQTFSEPEVLRELVFWSPERAPRINDILEKAPRPGYEWSKDIARRLEKRLGSDWKAKKWIVEHPVAFSASAIVAGGVLGAGTPIAITTAITFFKAGTLVGGSICGPIGAGIGAGIGISVGGCAAAFYLWKDDTVKSLKAGFEDITFWENNQNERGKYRDSVLAQYERLRQQIVAVCKLSVKGTSKETNTIKADADEKLRTLEDVYINYPLSIELHEGIVNAQYIVECAKAYLWRKAPEEWEKALTSYTHALAMTKRNHEKMFSKTSSPTLNNLSIQYDTYCIWPLQAPENIGRDIDIEKDTTEAFAQYAEWREQSNDARGLSIEDHLKTMDPYFQLLHVYTALKGEDAVELLSWFPPEGKGSENWKEQLNTWKKRRANLSSVDWMKRFSRRTRNRSPNSGKRFPTYHHCMPCDWYKAKSVWMMRWTGIR